MDLSVKPAQHQDADPEPPEGLDGLALATWHLQQQLRTCEIRAGYPEEAVVNVAGLDCTPDFIPHPDAQPWEPQWCLAGWEKISRDVKLATYHRFR